MLIGNNLKRLRESKKFTVEQVTEHLSISSSSYRKYEYNEREPSTDVVIEIADFYGVTTDYLLGREPLPNPFAELNLSNDDEAAVMQKFMSLPESFRACALELLKELGGAVKGSEAVQSNAQKQSNESGE